MDIVSLCPLRVTGRAFQPALFAHAYLVVCKATYLLAPGQSTLHDAQEEPNEDDNHWDDHPQRSLYAASDIVPYKRGADVVLVGHAYAPGGTPVRSFLTRVCVAELDKAIEVFADRIYTPHGEIREGQRVSRVRLRYERAAGGPGTTNPVGMRHDARDAFGATALPNFQPPGRHVTRPEDIVDPIGYGPIAPTWPSRQSRLGALASTFSPAHWYNAPLPEGLDPSFFNVAPLDQEIHELRPDERIVLEGLHPTHPRLVTNLPGLRPRALVERENGRREEIKLVADTLWIDTTRGVCTLVWRGRIPLAHPKERGRVLVAMEGPSFQATFPPPMEDAFFQTPISPDDPDGSTTMLTDKDVPNQPPPVMPFLASSRSAPMQPVAPPPRESGVFLAEHTVDDDEVTFVGLDTPAPNPLPFRPNPQAALPFVPPTEAQQTTATRPSGGLPFATPWPAQVTPQPPAPPPVFPAQDLPFATPQKPPMAPPQAPPSAASPAPPAFVPKPLSVLGHPSTPAYTPAPPPFVATPAPAPAPAPTPASASPPSPTHAEPVAPPLLGPLATPEMVARHAPPPPPVEPEPAPAKAPEVTPPAPKEPEPVPLPLEAYPIERCAMITASIARRREQRAEILEAEELSLALWADLEKHYQAAIQAEIERGKTKLLKQFDAAYVARLEEERGPIMPVEYARLVVAQERGQGPQMLASLGLPRGSMLRIERVFLARSLDDPALGEKIRRAVDEEREA